MPLLQRPHCPNCGDAGTKLLKTPASLARLLAALGLGLFVGDLVAIIWRCGACGAVFPARGSQATGSWQIPGSPVVTKK